MASVPSNLYDSYEDVGIKEDFSDFVYNISPVETPLLSAIAQTRASNRVHYWQTDALPTVDGTTGVTAEGLDPDLTAKAAPNLRGNYSQINAVAFGVSGSDEIFEKYGRAGSLAYQSAIFARWLKRQVEMGISGINQAAVIGDGTGTARKSASLSAWLTTNVSRGALGSNPTLSGGIPNAGATDGTQRAISTTLVNDVMTLAFNSGGKPNLFLMGPAQRTAFSALDGIAPRRVDASERRIYGVADVYMSNFGELVIVPTRHIRQTSSRDREAYVIDPDLVAFAVARPWQQFDLAKTGDSYRREMLVEWTLEMRNEAGHAVVADLT